MFARRLRTTLIAIAALGLLIPAGALATRAEERQGAQLLSTLQAGKTTCASTTAAQFELIGEYVMSRMAGSPAAHDAMNAHMQATMGAAGEQQAHEYLGRRFAGCATGAAPDSYGPMIGMMGAYGGATASGMMDGSRSGGMMGDYGRTGHMHDGWSGAAVLLVVLLGLALVTAIVAVTRRRSHGPTPQQILRERLARGEIDVEQYESSVRALQG